MKTVKLQQIRIDGGTQTRAVINNEAVAEYSEAVLEGAKFPPVDVFFDGAEHWLADGFHRYHAHKRAKVTDIAATVHSGSKEDALVFALGANQANGLRRTNEDKRKCVTIALERWPEWSDSRIAEICGVSHPTVGKIRPTVVKITTITERVGKDGVKQPATKPKAEVPPHPDDLDEPDEVEAQGEDDPSAPSEGLHYADKAIRCLERIQHNDNQRARAHRRVKHWLQMHRA
jgi:uncharacterized ParB-like nuclease family protein